MVPKGLNLQSAPAEVAKALNAGEFDQCLGWSKGLSIPTLKWDQKKNVAIGSLAKLPYVCGSDKAYRVKNAVKASMISPDAYKALSTKLQNGAYDLFDQILLDPYNPLDGRYSQGFETGVNYTYGTMVN
jgi:hypothetical protein